MAAPRPDAAPAGLRPALLLVLALAAAPPAGADLLHEALGPFERLAPRPFEPADLAVLEEFGLEEAEEAEYRAADGRSLLFRALQFYDDTGAVAAYAWLRPADGVARERGERAVEKGDLTVIQFANYVVSLQGDTPDEEDVELALAYLPRPKPTADPPVLQYVPAEALVARHRAAHLGAGVARTACPADLPGDGRVPLFPRGLLRPVLDGRWRDGDGRVELSLESDRARAGCRLPAGRRLAGEAGRPADRCGVRPAGLGRGAAPARQGCATAPRSRSTWKTPSATTAWPISFWTLSSCAGCSPC